MIRSNSNSPSPIRKKQKTTTDVILGGVVVVTLMGLPTPVRVHILNYFDEEQQEELLNLALVSKQMHADCQRPGVEWNLQVFEINVLSQGWFTNKRRYRRFPTRKFVRKLDKYQQRDDDTNNKLQRYRRMRVHGINEFSDSISCDTLERMTNNIRLYGIESLTFICAKKHLLFSNSLPLALCCMSPNLRELDCSNVVISELVFTDCIRKCPKLEKITWNNIDKGIYLNIHGDVMKFANNLRQLCMDASFFHGIWESSSMCDLNNHPDSFIFHKCCNKVLERLSIRNTTTHSISIPQNALIKFVRNVPPALKWFRSDLTQENMNMLQLEKPDIELVN